MTGKAQISRLRRNKIQECQDFYRDDALTVIYLTFPYWLGIIWPFQPPQSKRAFSAADASLHKNPFR